MYIARHLGEGNTNEKEIEEIKFALYDNVAADWILAGIGGVRRELSYQPTTSGTSETRGAMISPHTTPSQLGIQPMSFPLVLPLRRPFISGVAKRPTGVSADSSC